MPTIFENFINTEMPLRISCNEDGNGTGNIPADRVFVTTGIGKATKSVELNDITNSSIIVTANSDLGGGRIVTIFNDIADYADNMTNYKGQLAITNHSAVQNTQVKVTLTGIIIDPAWNFTNNPIWLDINGLFVQSEPILGSSILLGYPKNQTTFLFKPNKPIER